MRLLPIGLLLLAVPCLAADFVVTTSKDVVNAADGATSLREAVDAANATPGPHRITFAVAEPIPLASPLELRSAVTIEGPATIEVHEAGFVVRAPSVAIENCNFIGDGLGDTPTMAIENTSSIRISANWFDSLGGEAIHVRASTGVTIQGNAFSRSEAGIDAQQSNVTIAANSFFEVDDAIVLDRGTVEDNTFFKALFGVTATGSTAIRRNVFSGRQNGAIRVSADATIEANRITGVGGFGPAIGVTAGSARIVNNVLTNNDVAIGVTGAAARIVNNTIANNRGSGIVSDAGASTVIVNNILWNNAPDLSLAGAQQLAFNVMTDPLFASPTQDDWSLREGSPAIDAATPDDAPPADLFGQHRCDDPLIAGVSAYDAGAIERCPARLRAVRR